jgi:2-oxoglutarate ferredoxin oxidoreductase subunit delta
MPKPVIDPKKCNCCGECVKICPKEVFGKVKGKVEAVDEGECIGCRACEVQCPKGAIKVQD